MRWLAGHPGAEVVAATSKTYAGQKVGTAFSTLADGFGGSGQQGGARNESNANKKAGARPAFSRHERNRDDQYFATTGPPKV